MMRAIVTPPVLPPAALAELKQWLGISTTRDDAPLGHLLRSALDICEGFTGTMPLLATCEEVLPLSGCWQVLGTRPVQSITQVQSIATDGTRTELPASAYAIDLEADGTGRVLAMDPVGTGRIAVRFTAGLAADWDTLPDALRHGVIRLAAHQPRAREGDSTGPVPPASVSALWRPWRRMRLL